MSDVFDVDLGDLAEEDDDDFEFESDGDDEQENLNSAQHSVSYKKRRAALASALASKPQRRQTWEERYENDPLRADTPTVDFIEDTSQFSNKFIAISTDFSSTALIELREQLWTPHIQWARRSSLSRTATAAVAQEYTLLTDDMMDPLAQILIINSNSSQAVQTLLESEPLQLLGGVKHWQVHQIEVLGDEFSNLTNSLREPHIFVGMYNDSEIVDQLLDAQLQFFIKSGDRVSQFARLHNCSGESVGVVLLFNGKSNADAKSFLRLDPMHNNYIPSKSFQGPVNEQDVDGLHHLMARSFGQLNQLEQIHFMDPEDIFVDDDDFIHNEDLKEHRAANAEFLDELRKENVSYRYNRLDLEDFVGEDMDRKTLTTRNYEMSKFQKVRLQSAVEDSEFGGVFTTDVLSESSTIVEEDLGDHREEEEEEDHEIDNRDGENDDIEVAS